MRRGQREPGVPLGEYREHGVGVLLCCIPCGHWQAFDLEAVIERLNRRGLDGAAVGIKDLVDHVTAPCPACGQLRFSARPNWNRLSREFPCGRPQAANYGRGDTHRACERLPPPSPDADRHAVDPTGDTVSHGPDVREVQPQ